MSLKESIKVLIERVGRGFGGYELGHTAVPGEKTYSLAVGAPSIINVHGGFIVVIGLDIAQVLELRDMANKIIASEVR